MASHGAYKGAALYGKILPMKVSVIVTVKNEAASITGLLESLKDQSRQPDEIIISDGGSTDETVAIVESYKNQLPLEILALPGANISQGRNRAIDEAAGRTKRQA